MKQALKRWTAKYKNRRARAKLGSAYLYLWDKVRAGYENPATLDVLIEALEEIDREYWSIT